MSSLSRHQETMAAMKKVQAAKGEGGLKEKAQGTRKAALLNNLLYGEAGVKALCNRNREGGEVSRLGSVKGQELKDLQKVLWQYKEWCYVMCNAKNSDQVIKELRDVPSSRITAAAKAVFDLEYQNKQQQLQEQQPAAPVPVPAVFQPPPQPLPQPVQQNPVADVPLDELLAADDLGEMDVDMYMDEDVGVEIDEDF